MNKEYGYTRIPDDDYKKVLFQARGQVNGIMNCFRVYGQDHDVDEAIGEIMEVMEKFSMNIRGKKIPVHVRESPRRKPTE